MANNPDLISEIEEWLRIFSPRTEDFLINDVVARKLQSTLQRAREALRWIPVSERLPEMRVPILVQCDVDLMGTLVYYLCEYSVNFRDEPDWFDVHTGEPIEFEPQKWRYADIDNTPQEEEKGE